jgi:riboflavin biosynthesis pyrimidine reductase
MEPIRTLLDHAAPAAVPVLPRELHRLYGGDLFFPAPPDGRPYVIGNFVSTVDGVVSYSVPGHAGGGDISGHDEPDRFIMGLLRASADVVMAGSGTLHATAPEHLWIPECIYPQAAELYRDFRRNVLEKPAYPRTVIVSASGAVDLERTAFRTPSIATEIITTAKGRARLAAAGAGRLGAVEVTALTDADTIAPAAMLRYLRMVRGARLLLHEGGPTLFGEFVAAGLIDEFFLTVAPQIAGRASGHSRPGMISGTEFSPATAPWLRILSVKQCGDHLYLRYASVKNAKASPGNHQSI